MKTKNDQFNRLLVAWDKQSPRNAPHLPLCEECGKNMTGLEVFEGELGWFCGRECMLSAECMEGLIGDVEERQNERKQMGVG